MVVPGIPLAPAALDLRPRLAWTPQRDRAGKRLQLQVRAAVAKRDREPFARVLIVGLDRERRAEGAVVGAHRQHRVDPFRHRDGNHAVVRRQPVQPLVLDRPVVRDVAVDRIEVDVRRVDPIQDDAAVGGLGGEIGVDVGEADAFVDGPDLDPSLCLLQRDLSLHRLERDES